MSCAAQRLGPGRTAVTRNNFISKAAAGRFVQHGSVPRFPTRPKAWALPGFVGRLIFQHIVLHLALCSGSARSYVEQTWLGLRVPEYLE